jgi:nucleoside-diphosphate-sugar epimerase
MKVLVTGAGGFIGRQLVSHLVKRHQVFAVVRESRQILSSDDISVVVMDLSRQLTTTMLPPRIDVIVHLAQANVSFPEAANELLAVNTGSTQQLLDYGRRVGARRFILASTGDVYSRRFGPCKETDRVGAATFYGVTKHAAEMLTETYAGYLQTCILRLFHPYGPDQSNRLIPNLAGRIRQGKAVRLHKDQRPRVTPIYIEDVIVAIERAIDSSYSGIVNVAGDRVVSMRELAEEIGGALQSKATFEVSGEESADMIGDNELMKEVFGVWPMITLTEGLSRTFNGEETIA